MISSIPRSDCNFCRCACAHMCCKRPCHGCCTRCDAHNRALEEDSGITLEFDRLRALMHSRRTDCCRRHLDTSSSGCMSDTSGSRLDCVSESDSQLSSCSSTSCSSASCSDRASSRSCSDRAPPLPARAQHGGFPSPLMRRNQLTVPVSSASPRSLSRSSSLASITSISSVGSVSAAGGLRALHGVITELLDCGFYHEALGQAEAKRALQNSPEGTFLIRDSSDSRYIISISVATPKGVTSVRVAGKPGNYFLDCHDSLRKRFSSFRSPLQLVAYFMNLSVSPNQCVWLDSSGRKHSAMKLLHPLYTHVPSLQSLAHLAALRHEIQGLVDLAPS